MQDETPRRMSPRRYLGRYLAGVDRAALIGAAIALAGFVMVVIVGLLG